MTQLTRTNGYGAVLLAMVVLTIALLFSPRATSVLAQQNASPGQLLSPNQLDDLVAPIALYPDPLISQMLVATTYPLEIVEASQWLQRNPNLNGAALTQAAEKQDWDPSVQALVAFPDVLKYLTEDIAWTTSLGNAFLAQEADVMDAIQRMRARAAQSGKLTTTPEQQVTRQYDFGQTVYVITPTNPDVIYVPVYDPFWIWGYPLYYPYARWYYPPHAPYLYFNRGIYVDVAFGPGWRSQGSYGWNSWGWHPAWSTHNVVVNNVFIDRHNFNSNRPRNLTGTMAWSHDVVHRQGVPYPTSSLTERFRGDGRNNPRMQDLPVQGRGVASSVVSRSSGVVPNSSNRNREGFAGNESRGTSSFRNNSGNPNPATNRGGSTISPSSPTPVAVNPVSMPRGSNPGQPFARGGESSLARIETVSPSRGGPPERPHMREIEPSRSGTTERSSVQQFVPARGTAPSQPPVRQSVPAQEASSVRSFVPTQQTHSSAHASAQDASSSHSSGGGGNSRGRR
jgi:hypothetical protein